MRTFFIFFCILFVIILSHSILIAASCWDNRYKIVNISSICPVGFTEVTSGSIPCTEDNGSDYTGTYVPAADCAWSGTGNYKACKSGFFTPVIVSSVSVSGNPGWTLGAVPNAINSWWCFVGNQSTGGSRDMTITLNGDFSDLDADTEGLYFWNRSGVVKGELISSSNNQRKFKVYYPSWHRHDSPQTCGFGYFAVNKTKVDALPDTTGFPYYAITMWGASTSYNIPSQDIIYDGKGRFRMATINESNSYDTGSPYVRVWLIQRYNRADNNSSPTGLPGTTGGSWKSPISWGQAIPNSYSILMGTMTKTSMNAHDNQKTQMDFNITGY
jgi:hypothetical protein